MSFVLAPVMSAINLAARSLIAALLWPFQAWTPLAGLVVVSLLLAAILLVVFKVTSNQRAIAAARRQMQASLFELRLFEDDPRAVLRATGDLLRQQVSYLRFALVPMLWMILPLAVLIAHLQTHYGYEGLRPGESAVVTARFKSERIESGSAFAPASGSPSASAAAVAPGAPSGSAAASGAATRPSMQLDAPAGLRVDTPGVWTPSLREVAWRVTAEQEGDYELRLSSAAGGGEALTKRVRVTPRIVARAAVRPAPDLLAQFESPAEAPLPADSPVEAIAVAYPERTITVFGYPLHWIAIVVVLSTAFAFACRPLFDVVI